MNLWDDLTENPDDPWALAEAGWRMGIEHREQNAPAETVLLHRAHETYTESMWVQGYPALRMIVITHPRVGNLPGIVRTLPVGWRDMASAEAFRARFFATVEQYSGFGWVRKDHTARETA